MADLYEQLETRAFHTHLEETRVNHTPQADAVLEKMKNGQPLRDSDMFILYNTDQKMIDDAIRFDDIQDRKNSGQLTHDDIDFLIDSLGGVGELDTALRRAFYKRADEINYYYALSHQDEFSQEQICSCSKKLARVMLEAL
ncbi:MAG: hypothetical protein E7378_04130 [Clostridiales bacterium]|nr:hypothetical protein [Clostridiales bacterium]